MKNKYKIFKHNIIYKDGYFKKIMTIVITILILDLILLWFVW